MGLLAEKVIKLSDQSAYRDQSLGKHHDWDGKGHISFFDVVFFSINLELIHPVPILSL